MLGIISGTIFLHGKGVFKNLREKEITTEYGNSLVVASSDLVLIPRHGIDPENYILPHRINHQANMKALQDLGVNEVISVNSTGSLKPHIEPGMLVVPDDFIKISEGPTIFTNEIAHTTPTIDTILRQKWISAAAECGINVIDGGIYWQTAGPRFESRAEIAMMSQFADIVGMTMASEAIIAGELDLPYASLCSIDNFAHGIVEKQLTMEKVIRYARKNAAAILKIVSKYIERMET